MSLAISAAFDMGFVQRYAERSVHIGRSASQLNRSLFSAFGYDLKLVFLRERPNSSQIGRIRPISLPRPASYINGANFRI
ncbi:MAG TPA: hypothetical protein VKG91_10825 [Roseiarcus sp.]|nr:hypothetical protein [Roseiarcus sp.]